MQFDLSSNEAEYLGIFGLSWKDQVIYYLNAGAPGLWTKDQWLNVFDTLYYSYKMAVAAGRYKVYNPQKPEMGLFAEMQSAAAVDMAHVISFVNALYNATADAKIDPKYLNPIAGQATATTEAQAAAQDVAAFFQPITANLSKPVGDLTNKLIIAGATILTAYLIIPRLLTKGATGI